MSILITTGDPQKCIQINYQECPACGERFEMIEGVYLHSATLDDRVLVCPAHTKLTVEDELRIQDALQRALTHDRGRVQKDGVLLKLSKALKEIGYTSLKELL